MRDNEEVHLLAPNHKREDLNDFEHIVLEDDQRGLEYWDNCQVKTHWNLKKKFENWEIN